MLSDPQRSWTIDDAITENLDLPELLRDYLSQLADAAECDAAFAVLRELTVCDPTVGSGAFLFAALDVLDPLYGEVLARAEELEARGEPVPAFLAEARAHPSSRYWLLKTICLHNLFGVDLMREAPEIAKLRLFLKLAAQVEHVEDLEPLPDLDFNIKCGNLLVGIADEHDAAERLGDGRLDLGGTLANISTVAASVAADYDSFVAQQTQAGTADHADAKARLASRFDAARAECDRLLAGLRHEEGDLDDWVASHQPFHWFVEFPSVWQQGGFDVIIGNPPYIKTSKVTGYRWLGYQTQQCPDLYAVCMERATTLLNDHGRFAMIVMHSLCFSRDFEAARRWMARTSSRLWLSSYGWSPGGLFTGSAAVRSTILLSRSSKIQQDQCRIHATECRRWVTSYRSALFGSLEYTELPQASTGSLGYSWPFSSDEEVTRGFELLVSTCAPLCDELADDISENPLGFKNTALHFLGIYVTEPPTLDPASGLPARRKSSKSNWFHFPTSFVRDMALLMLSGRWGFLWWMMHGDSFHVTKGVLGSFPAGIQPILDCVASAVDRTEVTADDLLAIASALQEQALTKLEWKLHAGLKVGKYNLRHLRNLTDRADWLLAQAWGIEDAFEAAGNLRDRMVFGNRE